MVIGLTGGIASGKSTVSRILKELGAEIIDADIEARELMSPNTPVWQQVVARFGQDILNSDGSINRSRLGSLVFSDPEALKDLNHITHPAVIKAIKQKIAQLKKERSNKVLVLDVPLLIEAGMLPLVDEVWVVTVCEEIQIQRLAARDGLTHFEAVQRLKSQIPLDVKKRYADVIIDNNKSIEDTRLQVVKFWKEINTS